MENKLINAKEIQVRMNEFGSHGKPFLFVVDFEVEKGFFLEYPLNQNEILFHTPIGSNKHQENFTISERSIESFPSKFDEYKICFDKVMSGLQRGDSYLVNLTAKTPIKTNLSLKDIFLTSNSLFGLYIPGMFVSFSPERFVKIENGKIATNPMKGTISAEIPDARNTILNDKKETAEHSTVVDLLRNDLSKIAENVQVKRFRYIEKIKTTEANILQVSSEITGDLPENYLTKLGDIIFSMLPAGSISGAPKNSTLEIIHDAEKDKRVFYTGIFGYFDGKRLDTGVLIRFIAQENNCFYFHSGGGITALSEAEKEYEELINKIYLPS